MKQITLQELRELFISRRKELNMSLQQVGDIAGISRQRVSLFEHGAKPRADILFKLLEAVGIEINFNIVNK